MSQGYKGLLVGLHDDPKHIEYTVQFLKRYSKRLGYDMKVVRTLEEMIRADKEKHHEKFMMDVNLGYPRKNNIDSLITFAYYLEEERSDIDVYKDLLAFSGYVLATKPVKDAGFNAMDKSFFIRDMESNLKDFLDA